MSPPTCLLAVECASGSMYVAGRWHMGCLGGGGKSETGSNSDGSPYRAAMGTTGVAGTGSGCWMGRESIYVHTR